MRSFLCLCLLLWGASSAPAQKARTVVNALTPRQSADGWLLLFDGETPFGWTGEGIQVVDGELQIKGENGKPGWARHDAYFQNFEVSFEYAQTGDNKGATMSIVSNKKENPYVLKLERPKLPNLPEWAYIAWTEVRITDSVHVLWTVPPGSVLRLRNVKVWPHGLQLIFNGKDLTGWKEFPGKKSKFTVTGGALNIKDGPGDLQTERKYGNFILQMDCISNGEHLNSGVFFRCRPNEYQNGYEAQIRNQFTKEPTQEYKIETYDPETNKLLKKKTVKYTAVDYGTGAIYRRQPARKQVAKDGEWFTFTIFARQNLFMTWINGIQVTDWTDNRPKSDNARTGCRLEAGHISLQGHDPTTDLSFRAIRIAETK